MQATIRRFVTADYEAYVAVLNRNYPEHTTSAGHERQEDEDRDPRLKWGRYLAVVAGRVVGAASYSQNEWTYHPQNFDIAVDVNHPQRRQGIGTALFQKLIEALGPYDPVALRCRTREDYVDGVAFLSGLGFVEEERVWEMRLDPAGVDTLGSAALEERLRGEGVEIAVLTDLAAGDPEYQKKLFELDWETSSSVVQAQPATRPTLDHYVRAMFENAGALPDAWFVALHNGRYVGVSSLKGSPAGAHTLEVEFTGVSPTYRRRGIALALKLRTIAYAQAHGNPMLITWTNSNNQAMSALNERLGFQKQPAWIGFRLDLKASE